VTAILLPTHAPELFRAAVARAASVLRAGDVVALPTETVYGLAANALSAGAVRRIYEAKGRPAENPVIVHAASVPMARGCAAHWPAAADALAGAFWPGPLTLVLPKAATIPDVVTAGGPTVGIRWPQHPLMQAVILECGFPLAAPSANLANQLSPTTAGHVAAQLGDRIPLIVDAGACAVGIESTVVAVKDDALRILRPGMITGDQLTVACGLPVLSPLPQAAGPLASPGLLPRHYAPRATVRVMAWRDESDLAQQIASDTLGPEHIFILAHRQIPQSGRFANVFFIPDDPEAYARALYGFLHECDTHGARLVVVEQPPATAEWAGIRDRLQRASA
jgi:L-threonylcarbamoyladenylate synthase